MGIATLDYIRQRYVNDSYIPPLEQPRISVCTPLYNSTPFLVEYLGHVLRYDYPKDLLSLYFTVQGNDETYDILKEFKEGYGSEYRKVKFKRVKQVKGGDLPHVRNVVQCRNMMAEWSKPDMVFYNDHDNFNPPVSIKRLLEALALGASGAGGVYVFYQRNEEEEHGRIGFTSFFLHEGTMHHFALEGTKGSLPLEMFGRRMWMDSVSCGCFLVKRELLDELKFFVPVGTSMTDDTAFCLKAREMGHKFIADFGLLVRHWGYNVKYRKTLELDVTVDKSMMSRRTKMKSDGVYVHPDVDVNINDAVRKFIDIDKIK